MEKFTFFWSGIFSQWYPSRFMKDGIIYNCAEQYMMAKKAELFGDTESLEKIMNSKNPREQKAFGRLIVGFDKDKWEAVCKQYVYDANYAKFTQDNKLYEGLMNTLGTTLVEASPEDKIWGIGLIEHDPKAQDRATWEGTNWLGEVLTQVREDILVEYRAKAEPAPVPTAIGVEVNVSDKLYKTLKKIDTVLGTGINGKNEIVVYLENTSEISSIPKEFEGHKVITEVTEKFIAL